MFGIGPPVELRPNSHVHMSSDIMDDRVFKQLKKDASQSNQLWHFGLPCCSFSILQHSNGGTRRKHLPQGDGSLPREILGNELLRRTMVLIKAFEKAGNFWTLENPASSYVWAMPSVMKKLDSPSCEQALMHQCAYVSN